MSYIAGRTKTLLAAAGFERSLMRPTRLSGPGGGKKRLEFASKS